MSSMITLNECTPHWHNSSGETILNFGFIEYDLIRDFVNKNKGFEPNSLVFNAITGYFLKGTQTLRNNPKRLQFAQFKNPASKCHQNGSKKTSDPDLLTKDCLTWLGTGHYCIGTINKADLERGEKLPKLHWETKYQSGFATIIPCKEGSGTKTICVINSSSRSDHPAENYHIRVTRKDFCSNGLFARDDADLEVDSGRAKVSK